MRLRTRAVGLLFGAGVVFLMGTNAQAGWLLVIAALLVGAVLAGVLLPFVGLRGLRAELLAPDEATQGETTHVDVRLWHGGRGVRWGIRVADDHLSPADVYVDAVRAAERVEVTTERSPARRGRRRTTHVVVRTGAPFGVAERRTKLTVDAETLVLPSVVRLGPLPFVDPLGTAEPAIPPAPRRGHGPEYLGIREYRTGDSMRHVHWASTARHGAMMVREFEQEQTRRLLIVVDTERDPEPDDDAPTPFDRCCTVAASLAASALAHGHGSRLAAANSDGVDVLARSDEGGIRRWLAELGPSGVPFTTAAAQVPIDATRGAETVVLVAPIWDEDVRAAVGAVAAFRDIVPRVVCVLVGTEPPGHDRALHAAGAALVAAGAEVVPWPVGGDLAALLGAAPTRDDVTTSHGEAP